MANRNRMERAVANKFMPFYCLPCRPSKNHRLRRDVGRESGATSLFKGSLRSIQRAPRVVWAAEAEKSSLDRNMISFHSAHETQIRHSVWAPTLRGGDTTQWKAKVARFGRYRPINSVLFFFVFFLLCFHHSGTAVCTPAAHPLNQPLKKNAATLISAASHHTGSACYAVI